MLSTQYKLLNRNEESRTYVEQLLDFRLLDLVTVVLNGGLYVFMFK